METDRLTDAKIRAFLKRTSAAPGTVRKLADGGGLYLMRSPRGTLLWRIKYRFDGKERAYSVGPYPEIGLAMAREARGVVRGWLREGKDPVQQRRLARAAGWAASANTFGAIAEAWLDKRKAHWSDIHYEKSKQAIERDVLPRLGALPINSITTPMVARVVEEIAKRGAHETAGRVLQHIRAIFDLGAALGETTPRENPARAAGAALGKLRRHGRRPAILDIEKLRNILQRTAAAPITPSVHMALRLAAFSAQRIGNVVEAEWKQFELDGDVPTWTIPRSAMKVKHGRDFDHRVTLGPSIAHELRQWRRATGGKGFVFPSPTENDHITREGLEKVYRVTLGLAGQHSVHGWRSAFATNAREHGGFDKEVVDLYLDHVAKGEVQRAYDRGHRLAERVRLAQWWDAQLNPTPADVLPLVKRA